MFDDVFGWTDVSNNKAFFAEQISCTNNAESILWLGKRGFPEIGRVTDQAQNPMGPKGRFHLMNSVCHSIFNFSPAKDEARAFLRWLTDEKQLGAWYASADSYYQSLLRGYDNAPMWQVEPSPTAMRWRPRICPAGRRLQTGSWRRAWRNTWSWTCSPKPAPTPRPRR